MTVRFYEFTRCWTKNTKVWSSPHRVVFVRRLTELVCCAVAKVLEELGSWSPSFGLSYETSKVSIGLGLICEKWPVDVVCVVHIGGLSEGFDS